MIQPYLNKNMLWVVKGLLLISLLTSTTLNLDTKWGLGHNMPSAYAERFKTDKRPSIDWDLFDSRKSEFQESVANAAKEFNVPSSLLWSNDRCGS